MNWKVAAEVVGLTALITGVLVGLTFALLALLGDPLGGIVAISVLFIVAFLIVAKGASE